MQSKKEGDPSRFTNYKLVENGRGFMIRNCNRVFYLDDYGGWFDEYNNYYNQYGELDNPPGNKHSQNDNMDEYFDQESDYDTLDYLENEEQQESNNYKLVYIKKPYHQYQPQQQSKPQQNQSQPPKQQELQQQSKDAKQKYNPKDYQLQNLNRCQVYNNGQMGQQYNYIDDWQMMQPNYTNDQMVYNQYNYYDQYQFNPFWNLSNNMNYPNTMEQPIVVWVNNLDFKANENDIRQFFGSENVSGLQLAKGYAVIYCQNQEQAEQCISKNGQLLMGRSLYIHT